MMFSDKGVTKAVDNASKNIVRAIDKASSSNVAALTPLKKLMEKIMTNQEQLNQKLSVLALNVQDAIEAIKAQPGAEQLDFSQLDQANAALDAATPDTDRTPTATPQSGKK
jgi:hypothetical protein